MQADDGNKTASEVTDKSSGDRPNTFLFFGIVIALVHILGGAGVLVWNETNAVSTQVSLDQGEKETISISDIQTIDPANEGKLVHLSGPAVTNDSIVEDSTFGVTTNTNLLRLHRKVEYYQWVETKTTKSSPNTPTHTFYSYSQEWSSPLINSNDFQNPEGHENPAPAPYEEEKFTAEPVTLGAFTLPDIVIDLFSASPYMGNLSVDTIPDINLRSKTQVVEQMFYIGNDPNNATLGDMRISYEIIEPATVSIVAKQSSNTFTTYTAKAGKPVLLVEEGIHSSDEMYQAARDKATPNAWILRVCCPIIVWLGLILLWATRPALVAINPVLGDMVDRMAFGCLIPAALVISVTAVSLVWLYYRPAITAPLLFVCIVVAYYICWYRKQQMKREPEGDEAKGEEAPKDVELAEMDDEAVKQAIAVGEQDARVY